MLADMKTTAFLTPRACISYLLLQKKSSGSDAGPPSFVADERQRLPLFAHSVAGQA